MDSQGHKVIVCDNGTGVSCKGKGFDYENYYWVLALLEGTYAEIPQG